MKQIKLPELSPAQLDAIWQATTLLELIKQASEVLKQGMKDLAEQSKQHTDEM